MSTTNVCLKSSPIKGSQAYSFPISTWAYISLVIVAVFAETLDPGASLGLCLAYTLGLLLTQTKPRFQESISLALVAALPVVLLHQRNLLAIAILCLGLSLWLKKQPQDESKPYSKGLNPLGSKITFIMLGVLTLWMFFVEGYHNIEMGQTVSYKGPSNMLGTLALSIAWLCVTNATQKTSPWTVAIPLSLACTVSFLLLLTPKTLDTSLITPMLSHKNNIATVGTMALSILCYQMLVSKEAATKSNKKDIIPWIAIIGSVLLLNPSRIGSFSTITLLGLMSIGMLWETNKKRYQKILWTLIIIIMATSAINFIEANRKHSFLKENNFLSHQYDTSTGRLKIWEIAQSIAANKWMGQGESYWQTHGTPKMIDYNNFPAENAHSSFLEVYLAYGYIGLVLFIFPLLWTIGQTKGSVFLRLVLSLGVILPMLVESYSWAWAGTPILSLWVVFCLQTENVKV